MRAFGFGTERSRPERPPSTTLDLHPCAAAPAPHDAHQNHSLFPLRGDRLAPSRDRGAQI